VDTLKTKRTVITHAQGYVFVAPEYNFSLPPVLVNTITLVSKVGDYFKKLFTFKPIQLAMSNSGWRQ